MDYNGASGTEFVFIERLYTKPGPYSLKYCSTFAEIYNFLPLEAFQPHNKMHLPCLFLKLTFKSTQDFASVPKQPFQNEMNQNDCNPPDGGTVLRCSVSREGDSKQSQVFSFHILGTTAASFTLENNSVPAFALCNKQLFKAEIRF